MCVKLVLANHRVRASASGLRRGLEAIPTPPPAPSKEEVEQAEAARKLELQNLPPPPPAPRVPPVPATARSASRPRLTEEVQPVLLAPRPKERPQPTEQVDPTTSVRPSEPVNPPSNVWQDEPLILFDWHKTLSFPHQPIHESAIQLIRRCQSEGLWKVCVSVYQGLRVEVVYVSHMPHSISGKLSVRLDRGLRVARVGMVHVSHKPDSG